ncbi:MAG: lysine--tRNA ligase [Cellvibrionales bacterium]|nr:lysine--tRNA ligase [Cellvibrionales bacterium]
MNEKIRQAADAHGALVEKIQELIVDSKFKELKTDFLTKFPQYDWLTDVKILDLLLWKNTSTPIDERREILGSIRKKGFSFPNDWRREHLAADLQADHADKTREDLEKRNVPATVAGRIMARRGPFLVLQDSSGRIQAYTDKAVQADIKQQWGQWDIGDIVGIAGPLRRSGRGDLYVLAERYRLLTKSLRPLPEKHAGLADTELRYRQRYLDLLTNKRARQTFQMRFKIVAALRAFLDERSFMEVETPMLHVIPGGATARPFITHHHALDQDMYLRVAPELYLKRLVVGGFERVYELNRNFRNEGLSTRHNPEFSMLEFYQAYATYQDLMDLTEELLRHLAEIVTGTQQITAGQRDSAGEIQAEIQYDFGPPFRRLRLVDAVLEYNPDLTAADLSSPPEAAKIAAQLGIAPAADSSLGKLQADIFEKTVEHRLIQPTFIIDYPIAVSPLARPKDTDPEFAERFELFIGGRELANGFSELNDPEEQARRFRAQATAKEAGDAEAMHFDTDYIRALEHGLPPTAGEGIGIDRLVMLLTDSPSIRDVLLFPAMRPE